MTIGYRTGILYVAHTNKEPALLCVWEVLSKAFHRHLEHCLEGLEKQV